MDFIDDDGRLFGVVNIIDVLVVLLVLAVVIAGIALVNPFTSTEPATRYATVDLGAQPEYVASQISSGDQLIEDADGNLTVTDVYYTPDDDGQVRVLTRVRLQGAVTEDPQRFQYAGKPLQQGNEITLQTPEYGVTGTITHIDPDGATLATTETRVQLTGNVSTDIADSIQSGDTVTVADTNVATVEAVEITPTTDPARRHVTLGARIQTYTGGGHPQFGNQTVGIGASIPIATDDYALRGQVRELGSTAIATRNTDIVLETSLSTETAEALDVGDTYTIADREVASIQSLELYPAGSNQVAAVMGLSLRTQTLNGEQYFGGTPVKLGTTVPFRTGTYDVTGTVVRVGTLTPPGEPTQTTVRLKLANVPPEIADGIQEGMTENRGGTTLATITNKHSEPATVVLTSDDGNIYSREHPVNRDLTLTVTLQTRETDSGQTFHARSLQEDTEVVLDLKTITVRGTVIEIQP